MDQQTKKGIPDNLEELGVLATYEDRAQGINWKISWCIRHGNSSKWAIAVITIQ